MAVVLGLLVSLFYGSGDFLGAMAAKRTPTSAVVIGSFATSTVGLLLTMGVWAAVAGLPTGSGGDIALGMGAGLLGPVALSLLYRALAIGRMSVVAPTTAVMAAAVPFVWGLATGERPSTLALAGVGVALVAVGLISGAPEHGVDITRPAGAGGGAGTGASRRTLVSMAIGSGIGFGGIYVLLGSVSDGAGLWPLLSARLVALSATVMAVAAWQRHRRAPLGPALVAPVAVAGLVVATGVLDITANALYLAGAQRGLLSIVAVLSSLYPATTVLLARLVLHERLHGVQLAGLALAALGVTAMATG